MRTTAKNRNFVKSADEVGIYSLLYTLYGGALMPYFLSVSPLNCHLNKFLHIYCPCRLK